MILRLTCPRCNRDSYNASVETFKPCPYCGIVYSGLRGTSKRKGLRINKEVSFVFSHNGQFLEASTMNVSGDGMCVKIFGRIALSAGEVLDLHVSDSHLRAQVIWATDNQDTAVTVTGLRLLQGKMSL